MLEEFDYLDDFIGGYFHQDRDVSPENIEALVKLYLSEFHDDLVSGCLGEMEQLLGHITRGEIDADKAISRLGNGFAYNKFGYSGEDWLHRLKSLILKHRGQIKFAPLIKPDAGSQEPDSQCPPFSPYPDRILPDGFKYPDRYLELSKGIDAPEKLIWEFENTEYEASQIAWDTRKDYGENLIPFAQERDWAAYFDGNDTSGDPSVIVIDLGNTENTYYRENFAAWYRDALDDTEKYMR